MSCKKKEQSSCTSTPRRVLESLSIKDIAQARADCLANSLNSRKGSLSSRKGSLSSRKGSVSPSVPGPYVCDRDDCNQVVHRTSHRKGSVSPSVSGQHISVRDDCNQGIYRSSHHQWPGSSGTRPPSRKQSKTCTPLYAEVSAMFDGIRHCRDAIGALAQEAQSIISAASVLLDNCVCDNKSDQTKKKLKKVKKVDSCCWKILGKKGSNRDTCCISSWLDNCVCDEAETKQRKSNKVKKTASIQSCQQKCGKKSTHKVTASDCACNEKKKKQNEKIVAVDSKDSCCVCIAPKDLDYCFCKDDLNKKQRKVKKSGSLCSSQKKIEKKSSGNTCCIPPITADECACAADMKKGNKNVKKTDSQNCCKKMEKKGSGIPSVIADDCACDAEMSKTFCQKMVRKKSSVKDICCVPIAPKDLDDCVCEGDKKKQNNKVVRTESKHCCQRVFEKKTSDKDACCDKPLVFDDWTYQRAEKKMKSAKEGKLASAATSRGIPSCAENTCTCRFPPAYRQYFDCTGQINGSCQCDKNT